MWKGGKSRLPLQTPKPHGHWPRPPTSNALKHQTTYQAPASTSDRVFLLQIGSLIAKKMQFAMIVARMNRSNHLLCTNRMNPRRSGFFGPKQMIEFFLNSGIAWPCVACSRCLLLSSTAEINSNPSSVRSWALLTTSEISNIVVLESGAVWGWLGCGSAQVNYTWAWQRFYLFFIFGSKKKTFVGWLKRIRRNQAMARGGSCSSNVGHTAGCVLWYGPVAI